MDSGCNATQLIDGDGNFKADYLENFMKTTGLDQCGLNYAIVAIMGPQSSGKSTLLNQLFGTNFLEMNAFSGRNRTTKGIWMAKCVGVQPPTIVMDVEGTDGKERGENDATFEKQTTLFALTTSHIMLINTWCHDIGREHGASKPLLRIVFRVMVQMSQPRRTTILFVIRDKSKTPEDILGIQLREELQEIWDAVPKPEAHVNTPLSEFFTVEVIALSSYELMEETFLQEVDQLRQRFINSTAVQGGMAGDRRDVVPASGLQFSAENIWKDIKQNKDLDIPAHKLLVAAFRCEKIANETLEEFSANQELLALQKKMQEGYVPGAGKTLLSILDHYLEKKYDIEASLFDDDEKNGRRQMLKTEALQFVSPALRKMLENLSSKLLDNFKTTLERSLAKGKGFEASAGSCSESCMTEFLKGCEEAEVGQTDWDATNMKEKLQHDIDAHKSSLRHAKLSELLTNYENNLSEAIRGALGTLFRVCTDETWAAIRTLIEKETKDTTSEFLTAAAGFVLQENECIETLEKLRDHAKNMVKKEARIVANDVSASMLGRFTSIFTWNGEEDIQVLSKKAQLASLKLLSIMAAIRLDDKPDNIERLLVSSLHEKTTGPLTSKTWEEVCPEDTVIGPAQCNNLWYQFDENIKPMINKVEHMETRIKALSDESKERHELLKELRENAKKNQQAPEREANIFEIKIGNPFRFFFR